MSKELADTITNIAAAIQAVRGHRVMLDADLAALYGVHTKRFNEQVRRNRQRFPADFAFQVSAEEHQSLRSQNATLNKGRGKHRKYLPWVFTEVYEAILGLMALPPRKN